MRRLSASPAGVFPAGSIRELPSGQADALVASGQADHVETHEPEAADEPTWPRRKGAGWWEASDGETVRGEDDARAYEQSLHE
jgi:hypothetical protein